MVLVFGPLSEHILGVAILRFLILVLFFGVRTYFGGRFFPLWSCYSVPCPQTRVYTITMAVMVYTITMAVGAARAGFQDHFKPHITILEGTVSGSVQHLFLPWFPSTTQTWKTIWIGKQSGTSWPTARHEYPRPSWPEVHS